MAKQTVIAAGGDVSLPGERPVNSRHLLSCAFIVMGVYCLASAMATMCFEFARIFLPGERWYLPPQYLGRVLQYRPSIPALVHLAARATPGIIFVCLPGRLARLLAPERLANRQERSLNREEAWFRLGTAIVGFVLFLGAATNFVRGLVYLGYPVDSPESVRAMAIAWSELSEAAVRAPFGLYLFVGAPGIRALFLRTLRAKASPAGRRRG